MDKETVISMAEIINNCSKYLIDDVNNDDIEGITTRLSVMIRAIDVIEEEILEK